MALSDQKSEQFFRAALNRMREIGLAWVAEQVLDEVNRGKEELVPSKPRKRRKNQQFLPIHYEERSDAETRNRGSLARTVDYSAQERLGILLTALEQAIVTTSKMQDELVHQYGPIIFIPEQDQPERSLEFRNRSNLEVEMAQKLHQLIFELRGQLKT